MKNYIDNQWYEDLFDTSLGIQSQEKKQKPKVWEGPTPSATITEVGNFIHVNFPARPVAGVLNLMSRFNFHYLRARIWSAAFSEERMKLAVSLK